jgi:hypothetical protein
MKQKHACKYPACTETYTDDEPGKYHSVECKREHEMYGNIDDRTKDASGHVEVYLECPYIDEIDSHPAEEFRDFLYKHNIKYEEQTHYYEKGPGIMYSFSGRTVDICKMLITFFNA